MLVSAVLRAPGLWDWARISGLEGGGRARRHGNAGYNAGYRRFLYEAGRAASFMDPKEQIDALKDIRRLGLEMVGIYHSHVASPAYPSKRDIKLAFYPEVSYVIVSLGGHHRAQRPGPRPGGIRRHIPERWG
ncbi:MAG TPA: M67 family peptidase [Candidatus Latescibacteria bacterium]|nr:M67 family peptidase [Candidatus Latescibacterota bacterium]